MVGSQGAMSSQILERVLSAARQLGASDVHLKAGLPPIFRIKGELRTVRDVMHGRDEAPLVGPGAPMREALLVMTEKRFGCVGVVDADGKLAGIITDGDLRRHIDGLFDHTAGEVMTPAPKSVTPGMLAVEALKRMTERAPSSTVLFVVDAGRPVGILHIHDLVRAGVI